MKSFTVSSPKDLYTLKNYSEYYDEITIDLQNRQLQGLIRHAVKYSVHALLTGGKIIIHSAPFSSYVLQRNKIDFWQVKYEVFGCLKDSVETVEVNAAQGTLVLKKTKHLYHYTGVSFGIVFSGNKEEEKQLIYSIESIIANIGIKHLDYEIIICGPSGYSSSSLTEKFEGINLRYISLDIAITPRLMICKKKNKLYEEAKNSLVIISHTRINYSPDFIEQLMKYPVEMVTPAIYYIGKGMKFKYLDLSFIDNYQDLQLGATRGTVAGENIQEDYLHWYRKRVPFIDGGLNIFNKNIIKDPPYNNFIAWGEAEDVDLCNRLYQTGVLIDYLPAIKCFSATCKVTGYNKFKAVGRKIFHWMNKNFQ